jgi:membrane protease subunit HflK
MAARKPNGDFDIGRVARGVRGMGPFWRKVLPVVLVLAVIALGVSGAYVVGPGEQAVVRSFGRESGKAGPGLHYALPFLQKRDIVNIAQIRRIEVGFRGQQRVPDEALMLTGDENIVAAHMIVQWRVTDPSKFLFRLKDPEDTLRASSEVALRAMVGRTKIDDLLTTGRERVQAEAREYLQKLMNGYDSGIAVTELKLLLVDAPDQVREAFHEVVRAREEKEKLINQARGYQADVIPRARGEAEKQQREAEAYREQRVLRANGDAAQFNALLVEYEKAPRVTRQRLWLEAQENTLARIENKVFVDEAIAKSAVPVLPIPMPGGGAAAAQPAQVAK